MFAFPYDPNGNRRLLVADNTGRYTRTFDPLNQTLTSTNAVDLTLTFTYDPLGRRLRAVNGLRSAARRITFMLQQDELR